MKTLILWQMLAAAGVLSLIVVLTPPDPSETQASPMEGFVTEGKQVLIEYTLWLDEETAVESNVGGEPLSYIHGSGLLVPGLEKALAGMKVGQRTHVTVPSEEAYGPYLEDAVQTVGRDQITADALEPGTVLSGEDAEGRRFTVQVQEVREDTVVLNTNHPLAGKTLYFSVRILDIKDPEPR
jgi:FKBP-type peptidyl-prolyl cis-trans isomerase SlyD